MRSRGRGSGGERGGTKIKRNRENYSTAAGRGRSAGRWPPAGSEGAVSGPGLRRRPRSLGSFFLEELLLLLLLPLLAGPRAGRSRLLHRVIFIKKRKKKIKVSGGGRETRTFMQNFSFFFWFFKGFLDFFGFF